MAAMMMPIPTKADQAYLSKMVFQLNAMHYGKLQVWKTYQAVQVEVQALSRSQRPSWTPGTAIGSRCLLQRTPIFLKSSWASLPTNINGINFHHWPLWLSCLPCRNQCIGIIIKPSNMHPWASNCGSRPCDKLSPLAVQSSAVVVSFTSVINLPCHQRQTIG
jgi:hypothetical protein